MLEPRSGGRMLAAMQLPASANFGLLNTKEVKRRHILAKALLVGIVAGLVASAFRAALIYTENFRIAMLAHVSQPWSMIASILVGAGMGALGVWLVARFCPEAAGSGIPHLKSVVLGERELHWTRVLPIKFLAGLAAIGGGMTLGREGPTIQMGGACGLGVGSVLRVKRGEGERKALISAGAGAGLAAAFNAPLAGVVFVVEELQGNFTPVIFVASFLASVSADIVARFLLGDKPVLILHAVTPPTNSTLPFAAVIGLVAGFGGVIFNRTLLAGAALRDRVGGKWAWLAGAVAGALVGAMGAFYPRIVGTGNDLLEQIVTGATLALPVLIVLLARFTFTMTSYSSGAAGGIFAPLLILGSLAGLWCGQMGHAVAPNWIQHPEIYAILGMGALFTATVRAPLTGIVLMVELTGEYGFMLPLLVSCLIAYGIAEALGVEPIYEALRHRSLQKAAAAATAPAGTATAKP